MHSPLLLQLVVILSVARLCGLLLKRFGQPAVIGEMAAGILLGPIVFGAALPQAHAALFPADSLAGLTSLSTLGLVLFMFVVGAELRTPDGVRAQLRAAGWVSALSVVLPFGGSLAVAPWLYPQLAPAGVGYWPFALFLATAMSITAFPVLARILKDRGMTRSRVGQLALGSAAIADAATWIGLALVVALVGQGGEGGVARALIGLLALTALVFGLLKPLYAWLLRTHARDGEPSAMVLAALLVGLLSCAALTEWLDLHAVFGAFVFGACLPRDDRLLHALTARLEHVAVVLLMPIFFALAGLRTTGDAFTGTALAAMAVILVVAVTGKIVGGAAGARLSGHDWRDSFATGALMNARGLMELIVLKVGLDAGLIGPQAFTMLLAMAILTTVMTGPLLGLFAGRAQAAGDGLARNRA
ncbi:cation:proton antiporter [Lysobacter niastensis]|uniref:Cation:proton antiporter n=1 Tax=Lysobacter niastensis TaxID=380629 RepID=A0ABS0B6S0_9GAMM|nr:cation:proton antiporter [Lysobacter niastensis]MBF6023377.1 cation:proton antiporter [Lysobacter niastensis]